MNVVKDFGWLGLIIDTHTIGEYTFVSYHPRISEGSTILDKVDMSKIYYGGYINGKKVSQSYSSLDEALLGFVALKHDGINTRADIYMAQMLKIV